MRLASVVLVQPNPDDRDMYVDYVEYWGVVIRKNCKTRKSRGLSVKTVFVMETAQDWRCRNSAACWNRTAA
jgi:hypothetical protein